MNEFNPIWALQKKQDFLFEFFLDYTSYKSKGREEKKSIQQMDRSKEMAKIEVIAKVLSFDLDKFQIEFWISRHDRKVLIGRILCTHWLQLKGNLQLTREDWNFWLCGLRHLKSDPPITSDGSDMERRRQAKPRRAVASVASGRRATDIYAAKRRRRLPPL